MTEFVVKTGSHSHVDLCSDKIESGVFLESLITVAAAIPSNIFAVLGMDTLGRKFFLGKYQLNDYNQGSNMGGSLDPQFIGSTNLGPAVLEIKFEFRYNF